MAKKKRTKKIDLYDTDHPFRRTAIDLIQNVIGPLLQRGINGKRYYDLEDNLTIAINNRIGKLIKKPLQSDTSASNGTEYECSDCGHCGTIGEEEDEDNDNDDDDEDNYLFR